MHEEVVEELTSARTRTRLASTTQAGLRVATFQNRTPTAEPLPGTSEDCRTMGYEYRPTVVSGRR